MKHFFRSLFLFLTLSGPAIAAVQRFGVAQKDVHDGFVTQQIWLQSYGVPAVKLTEPVYTPLETIPEGANTGAATDFTLMPGMDAKKPFALIRIPAYTKTAEGKWQVLTGFSLDVTEPARQTSATWTPKAKTTGTATPLSSGNWYKIAVPERGVYKIDYAFVQSLGISGNVSSAGIRLVGNGGALLSENNAIPRPLDLTENALWVSDGGDGTFGSGDFIAFYAPGPMRWDKDSLRGNFRHAKHLYADSSYYFISFDAGAGLRIAEAPAAGTVTTTVTTFDDYTAHEVDLYNPGKFGKEWWGEKFGLALNALPARDFNFPLNGFTDSVRIRISAASRAESYGNQMAVTLNGAPFATYLFSGVSLDEDKDPVDVDGTDIVASVKNTSANFQFTYTAASEATGYLNFIELNWRRPLAFAGGNFTFRDWRSVGAGNVASYNVAGATSATQIWDVTDPLQPRRMNGVLNGSTYTFAQRADALHEFAALDGSTFLTPVKMGKVAAQNLHGADAPKLVIVTHPQFLDAANELGEYHRQHDGMRVLVATTQQVYNEFSSGSQDISGIRDMMRYFYQEAGTDSSRMPRYLLLFGDASYDYKDRIASNSNYVPTYQSADGVYAGLAYTVDDFYGFLDDNENMSNYGIANTLDIGIGRLPVNTTAEAAAAVAKIKAYGAPTSLGPWKLNNTYIGDNEDDAGLHLGDAEDIEAAVDERSPFSNSSKVYLDNLNFIATPSGVRCPDANKAINDQIFKGTFLINYTGHGSTVTLGHERILIKEDFSKWKNLNKLPFMVTATCDYARYDNPAYVSNGEAMVLKGDGGTIAMMTTTGPVYATHNREINQQFLTEQYTKLPNGQWPTFGDAMRAGKNITFRTSGNEGKLLNFYRFTLLGDPAVQPAFPQHVVYTDSIREMSTGVITDSLRALGKYTLTGHIANASGNLIPDFKGRAYVTIYDKPRLINVAIKTPAPGNRATAQYYVRDNVIFKGITTVEGGRFSCSFIAPKDINYDFGKARISYYAENGVTDAAGMDTTVTAGGFSDGVASDNAAPVVKPFIGDTLFRNGGITGANTLLYVQLADDNGINASGNGVGHDITAVLDGDEQHPYSLNDYYETEPNTYQRGHVSFPVTGLADGEHTFTVKAWDVYNNSGTGSVRFVVGDGRVMHIQNLVNYPNPFTDQTHFFFEHNHPSEVLDVQIAVYNTAGIPVKLLRQTFTPGGSHSNEIIWDGRADNGAQLPSGVYPYRMILSTQSGIQTTAYQKLVIVR